MMNELDMIGSSPVVDGGKDDGRRILLLLLLLTFPASFASSEDDGDRPDEEADEEDREHRRKEDNDGGADGPTFFAASSDIFLVDIVASPGHRDVDAFPTAPSLRLGTAIWILLELLTLLQLLHAPVSIVILTAHRLRPIKCIPRLAIPLFDDRRT